jgi:pantoate--beta-alanine ligase
LKQAGCDVLFNPGVTEMYDDNEKWHLDIGDLEHLLEGKFQPGALPGRYAGGFKLFNIVKPDVAFLGKKIISRY